MGPSIIASMGVPALSRWFSVHFITPIVLLRVRTESAVVQLPEGTYTKPAFIDYLLENGEEVAPPDPRHRWLKVYTILSADIKWKDDLFANEEIRELGEITEIRLRPGRRPEEKRDENYYVMEHAPGLFLFFTTAIKEHYETTLGERLRRTRGITPLWSSPAVFDRQWKYLLSETGGFVQRFMSRRASTDEATGIVRPHYSRRFNYTGDDGTEVMEELREDYGVLPRSIYVKVGAELTVHLTNDGLFSAKIMSRQAFELFFGMMALVRDQVLGLKQTSQDLSYRVESFTEGIAASPRVAAVQAGVIRLVANQLSPDAMIHLRDQLNKGGEFSVIDEQLTQGSMGFAATIVDERKGSVFNISASERQIVLVPKYNYTFESFIRFYRAVAEIADSNAVFLPYR